MKSEHIIFLFLLFVNFIIAILYLVISRIHDEEGERKEEIRLKFAIMLFCPFIGEIFFFTAQMVYIVAMRKEVNLEDVIFSKERTRRLMKADEKRESNFVPMEEEIAVGETADLRQYVLNVLKGDIMQSLDSISLALQSEDTETSHYAASVLSDALNEYRIQVQKMNLKVQEDIVEYKQKKEEQQGNGIENQQENEELQNLQDGLCEYLSLMIFYMNRVLQKRVFTDVEQKYYVHLLEEQVEKLRQINEEKITVSIFSNCILRMVEIKEYDQAEQFGQLMLGRFPNELNSYKVMLQLFYEQKKKVQFFELMKKLRESGIVIDKEIMELFRVFQTN